MQKLNDGRYLFSASDLVHFLGCNHSTVLDLRSFTEKLEKAEDSASNKLLQEKGFQHEAAYLKSLQDAGKKIVEIPKDLTLVERARLTKEALEAGVDVVFQGVLYSHPWRGDADFLVKVAVPSKLGSYSYEVVDTKLARHPAPKHVIQLCVYADLLSDVQGQKPRNMYLILGDGTQVKLKVDDFFYYYQHAKKRFESFVAAPVANSYPEPCQHCQFCSWRDMCSAQWSKDDHLSLVANIQRSQSDKLRAAGITTVAALAVLPADARVPDLNPDVFERLRSQAILQKHKQQTGKDKVELISFPAGRGFERMPVPDSGDLFFDMEGDPLYPDGLEYLFGVYTLVEGKPSFRAFWAHSHEEEREAFREFMAFLDKHLALYPNAYIYHYNHYETTALKRLACRYALAEEQLDNLLRQQKFIDLYKVVRESVRVSESGYSIKNMEVFYMDKRSGAVATAADSIVSYNQWRETQDDTLLKQIVDYNEIDCISTHKLRDWLLGLRPDGGTYFTGPVSEEEQATTGRKDWEIEYEECQKRLLSAAPEGEMALRQRLAHLLEFHNREAKPQWWASFERQDKSEDEIIDDNECLGGLVAYGSPAPEKRSMVYTYRFPPQDCKLRAGSSVRNVETRELIGTIFELDADQGFVSIKRSKDKDPLPHSLSIGPQGPVNAKEIRAAVYRVATEVIAGKGNYKAVRDILNKAAPRLLGKAAGSPIIGTGDLQVETLNAVAALDNSYIFIQGPPGAGKTFTSAHVVVELMRRGKKVGITANSHKAIHNLLDKIEEVAAEKNFTFRGIKKSSAADEETVYSGLCIKSEAKADNINTGAQLLAGTAWLFSDARFNDCLDYLFIDEAGQVSVANVVAMGTSAKNIVLVGDQMQLGQPIQGVHPGEAGLSILEFLLGEHATIPPDRGIFLDKTRRLDPSICGFISEAFYDGRLEAHADNIYRQLMLGGLPEANKGIHFQSVQHKGCSQKSAEEGAVVDKRYLEIIGRPFQDKDGTKRPLTANDVLVVTPYNVQVNHLKSVLPNGARVGTVDKFQGQEAPVVLVSLVTSSAEDLPRNIEFLYSKNRLNVALSRAQCLAMVVMNPRLLEVPCKTIEQMKLVNTFCWLEQYILDSELHARAA